jgi:hypothetical protein
VPHAPETEITGRIIKIYGGLAEAGPQSIVTINKGAVDGIEVGHVLAINRFGKIIKDPEFDKKKYKAAEEAKLKELNFQVTKDSNGKPVVNFENNPGKNDDLNLEPGMIKLPDERIGLVMIFRTFDNICYGLVMQANEPVNMLDSVKTP